MQVTELAHSREIGTGCQPLAPEHSDADLLDRYARLNCQDAFRILYERYDRKLHSFLIKRFRLRKEDRDDVAQQVWACVVAKRGRCEAVRSFAKWLMAIAANQAVNHIKKQQRNRRRTGESLPEDSLADWGSAERTLLQRSSERLLEAIEQLRPAHHQAIWMVHYEGLPVCEAAVKLGVAESTLYGRLLRARNEIKSLFA